MVTVNATTMDTGLFLVLENTNLYDFPRYAVHTFIGDRSGRSLGGVALDDVIDYTLMEDGLEQHVIWNGSGIIRDAAGDVTAGRLTAILGTSGGPGGAQALAFSVTGLNISAAAYWNTLETPANRSDDVALMQRAFAGNDTFRLSAFGDQVSAGAGNDTLFGNDGADRLLGGSGADRIEGGSGSDRLFGGDGADRLLGGAGNDRLYGEAGSDTLTGGAGNDVFVFNSTSGSDLVTDFNAARDRVLIEYGANSVADLTILTKADRVTISFDSFAGSTVITLTGAGIAGFDAGDILFG